MAQTKFYAFALNEYRYRVRSFTVHVSQEQAEKAAYRAARGYNGTAQTDLEQIVIEGHEVFINWAEGCGYEIDWENRLIKYKGEKA